MNGIEEFLKKKKVQYVRIDGRVPIDERYRRVDEFQNSDTCKVAVLSINACS
jgi:SWI/SNF-related matrix-associated actin-dependent regulator 1 of chromatin subfamily A